MSRQQAKKLYEGKRFYVMNTDGTIDGPRDDIYYVSYLWMRTKKIKGVDYGVDFVQVIDGKIVQGFKKKEILVLKNGKQVA